jgi:hypothetical protein
MSTRPSQRTPAAAEYLRMLGDRKWLVALFTLLGFGLALLTRPVQTSDNFDVSVPIEIQSLSIDGTGAVTSGGAELPTAEVQAARSVAVAEKTAKELGIPDGGTELLTNLTVEAAADAPVLFLSMSGEGPRTVDRLQVYAENFVEARRAQEEGKVEDAVASIEERIAILEPRLADLSSKIAQARRNGGEPPATTVAAFEAVNELYRSHLAARERVLLGAALAETRVRMLSEPFVEQISPVPTGVFRLVLFPLAGLLAGCAIALTLGVLRPKVFDRSQLDDLGVPVLAVIPQVRRDSVVHKRPLLLQGASAWGAESIAMLRAELSLDARGAGAASVAVAIVSPSTGEGKSTIATNLAALDVAPKRKVTVFRSDVGTQPPSRPTIRPPGTPEIPLKRRANREGFDEIFLSPTERGLRQDVIAQAMIRLADEYDTVIVDTPPLLHSADALVLAAEARAVVIVARAGRTTVDEVASSLDLLRRHDVNLVGVVLNGHRVSRLTGYGRAYRASSKSSPTPTGPDVMPYGLNGRGRGADRHDPARDEPSSRPMS